MDGNDVGMQQSGENTAFFFETLGEVSVFLWAVRQNFERHLAAEGLLDGAVDGGHPPAPDLAFDLVAHDLGQSPWTQGFIA